MPSEASRGMRLHPVSVPYRAGRRLVGLIGPAVLVVIAARSMSAVRLGAVRIAALAGVVVLAVVGWEFAYYRRFEYRLVRDTLEIDSGVLSRRTREIPRGRIQNLDIQTGVVGRIFGVTEVSFETAGGEETEARLRYVSRGAADRLQAWVDRGERGPEGVSPAAVGAAEGSDADRDALYAITPRELTLLSLTSLDLRSLGLVIAAAFGVIPTRFGPAGPPAGPTEPPGVDDLPGIGTALSAAELSAIAILGNAALRTARYFRFQLWRENDTLRYERGLLRRYSGSIPLDRLHLLRLRDNPLSRLAGYAALDVETAGYGPEAGAGSEVAVPIAPLGRARAVAADIEPHERPTLTRPPRRARRRYAVRYTLLVGVLTALLYAVSHLWRPFPWYAAGTLLIGVPPAAHLTWVHRGYAVGDRHLLVRRGFWRRATYVVPYHRVQTVAATSTPFQRRLGLATLRVDTASGTPAAVDIDADAAAKLRERVADELQLDRRRRSGALTDPSGPGFRWVGEADVDTT